MLQSTFRHLTGIGERTERAIWRAGISSWEEYARTVRTQLVLPGADEDCPISRGLTESVRALAAGDTNYFATRLPRSEHYRIALTFPQETMFLDIETTGLSRYYDQVTLVGWSLGTVYDLWVAGESPQRLQKAISRAKALVTFNGSGFDIPFLRQTMPQLVLPEAHVDLRFMAKRVGLTGGQKAIEEEIGLERSEGLKEVDGYTATVLWARFLRGEQSALEELIAYNEADVLGMRAILDVCIGRTFEVDRIPAEVVIDPCFGSTETSRARRTPGRALAGRARRAHRTNGVTLAALRGTGDAAPGTIVGIDLSGSSKRRTGWCALEGASAHVRPLRSDDEIIERTLEANPALVSIDSPLSLPFGRRTVSDSDPGRCEYGIMRVCERALKARGINVYPCLIRSMQSLTERGIELAGEFRRRGIPVIECYPGAAQDIMGIPRRKASTEMLTAGLSEFGVRGEFVDHEVSHDELDAVTSAIVGVFFWAGRFEALGCPEEDYLIIPSLDTDRGRWDGRRVVGLSGPIGSGKTSVGRHLESRGFRYTRFSHIIKRIAQDRGLGDGREVLQRLGQEIHETPGQRWLAAQVAAEVQEEGRAVIDGLRFPDDHAYLVEAFGPAFVHVTIETPEDLRRDRHLATGTTTEEFARAISHRVESGVPSVASLAHAHVRNSGTCEELMASVDGILAKLDS